MVARAWGVGRKWTAKGQHDGFWGEGIVLYLDHSDGYMTVGIC